MLDFSWKWSLVLFSHLPQKRHKWEVQDDSLTSTRLLWRGKQFFDIFFSFHEILRMWRSSNFISIPNFGSFLSLERFCPFVPSQPHFSDTRHVKSGAFMFRWFGQAVFWETFSSWWSVQTFCPGIDCGVIEGSAFNYFDISFFVLFWLYFYTCSVQGGREQEPK